MERLAWCLAAAFAAAVSAPVAAQDERWRGEALAAPCFACHGPQGESPGTMPSLDEPEEVGEELRAFRSGEKGRATIMGRIAKGYTDEEIRLLGRYFRQLNQGGAR